MFARYNLSPNSAHSEARFLQRLQNERGAGQGWVGEGSFHSPSPPPPPPRGALRRGGAERLRHMGARTFGIKSFGFRILGLEFGVRAFGFRFWGSGLWI